MLSLVRDFGLDNWQNSVLTLADQAKYFSLPT